MRSSGWRRPRASRADQPLQSARRDPARGVQRTRDRPFDAIEDVISRDELVAMSEGYKRIAGYDRETLAR